MGNEFGNICFEIKLNTKLAMYNMIKVYVLQHIKTLYTNKQKEEFPSHHFHTIFFFPQPMFLFYIRKVVKNCPICCHKIIL